MTARAAGRCDRPPKRPGRSEGQAERTHANPPPRVRRRSVEANETLLQGAGNAEDRINHAVKDIENWLKYKAERAAQIAPFGSNVTDHVAIDGSNNVAIPPTSGTWRHSKAAMAAPPPELAAAMDRHGVIPPPSVHIEK